MTDITGITATLWATIRQRADGSVFFLVVEASPNSQEAVRSSDVIAIAHPNWHAANPVIGYRRVQCTILPE